MRDAIGDVAATCLDVAEAMALRHALVITMESGFLKVCLETDNLKLFHNLRKGSVDQTAFGLIIKDILLLASSCHVCTYAFVKREGNKVTHSLAKLSCNFNSVRVWLEEYPSEIHDIVMAALRLSSS
ncbi:uncharacterized protein LOC110695581 [Chenopodium quinoa]|uniref:uncharacterized protein LOC110695581 n=1 Tax=Chenopodium quinoa TaxID=63459 RepID=UPI000B77149D|nr:uncharacterized protein LOC110695581 [Chenopodium quinoa]